jgi:hypothetical protein
MYILNPSKTQLNEWYRCGFIIANYLINKGLNYIYCDEYFYYFVKTDEWKNIHKSMPFFIKFFELL